MALKRTVAARNHDEDDRLKRRKFKPDPTDDDVIIIESSDDDGETSSQVRPCIIIPSSVDCLMTPDDSGETKGKSEI